MSSDPRTLRLRDYLLGALPEDSRTALEDAYVSDAALLDDVSAVEHDLVDDYVAGRLAADDRRRFEGHYLASTPHRQRVAIARALRDASIESTPTEHAARGRWPALTLAAAAILAVAVAALIAWLALRPAPAPPQRASVPPRDTVPRSAPPPSTPAPSPSAPIRTTPSPDTIVALTLSPILLRGDSRQIELVVPANATGIRLAFRGDRHAAPDTNPPANADIAITIANANGRRVWTGRTPSSRDRASDLVASVTVPASTLPADDYIATLVSIDPAGRQSEIARYTFRIRR